MDSEEFGENIKGGGSPKTVLKMTLQKAIDLGDETAKNLKEKFAK